MARRPLSEVRAAAVAEEERRKWTRGYPSTPMVDESFVLGEGALAALIFFRERKPFRATPLEYLAMVQELYDNLSIAYDMPTPEVSHEGTWDIPSYGHYYPDAHHIVLKGRLSILTMLHEFGHAQGFGDTAATWWSVNAFRLVWPQSFAKLEVDPDHPYVLRRRRTRRAET